jgi:hypothetical protein
VEEYGTARQAADCNITQRMHFACWISKATCAQTHARVRGPTPTLKHALTHARSLTHEHTHREMCNTALALQQLFRERA